MLGKEKRQVLRTSPEEIRRQVQTQEFYRQGGSVRMTLHDNIARELGLRQVLDECDEDDPNPRCIQSIGPDVGEDKISLDLVW